MIVDGSWQDDLLRGLAALAVFVALFSGARLRFRRTTPRETSDSGLD
ncbi:hypothetical protein [Aquipuribacter nitratireducens]|uniref:Uncharacterized protein n=1 Tax=Aquipuribacter nitratireducens TaxID=650104 RepID=A0ABW0GMW0_9MICO